jgi:hypothetical protein
MNALYPSFSFSFLLLLLLSLLSLLFIPARL